MWYAIVAILILIADQGLKYWVTVNIALDTGHVTLIPGVLELTNIHNNGAAFSMLEHAPHWIFIIFTLVFAAIAVFCLRRNVVHGKVGRWSVVLVLAGAVGNCIDRILSGYVVDMFNFLFVRFAVFNLADVFIVVAGITLCLHVIFYRGDDGADDAAPKAARKQRTGALIDAAGNVVSSQNAELLGEDLADDPIFQQITAHRQAGENNFLCELNGVDTLTIFKYNTTYNVYLAATIPQAYITNGTRTINMMLIALAAVLVVVSVFLTLLVYRSVMHPIDNMVAACNAKSDEEIGLKINDPSPDELGFLARTIDNMVNEIGLLAQRWSDDQRKMRELELQTLQYQINPHFLFNTLNTLKWIATLNHVTPVSHGIDALSSLLQSTLIKKDELIPFDDELRNLKNYCDIQQLRYAGRFEMEYQIEDAAGYWTVPRFILQPLVENSILHGTADEDDFVTITVRATVSENLLTIHISDTGCGFDPSAIKEKNSERFSGIGLSNVDERMRLHYGNEYGLTIESAPGIGTQCILCIPNEAIR